MTGLDDRSKKRISEAAGLCPTFSSSVLTPGEMRRSQSLDSVVSIESTPYHLAYLKFNLSLPDVHEILFHRRTNRLSYDSDFETEERDDLSFWKVKKGSRGRLYNPSPTSRKLEALKLKSGLLSPNLQPSSSQRSDGNSSSSSLELSDYEHTCDRGASYFTKKLLDSMEDEYPTRHSLWMDSPGRSLSAVNPEMLARGLKAVQQELFCRMESGELLRCLLKPRTVTEVNSPYLCGYLYFYERVRRLVVSELLAKEAASEKAEVFGYCVRVAYSCLQLRDKQSTCAILSGLCSPTVLRHPDLWSTLQRDAVMRIFSQLVHVDWSEERPGKVKSEIPFFRSALEALLAELPRGLSPHTYKRRRFSEFLQEWHQWAEEKKKPDTLKDQLTNAWSKFKTKCNLKKRNSQAHTSDDLFTTRYRELENISGAIEEFRKYYSFTPDTLSPPIDEDARYILLYKKT